MRCSAGYSDPSSIVSESPLACSIQRPMPNPCIGAHVSVLRIRVSRVPCGRSIRSAIANLTLFRLGEHKRTHLVRQGESLVGLAFIVRAGRDVRGRFGIWNELAIDALQRDSVVFAGPPLG